MHFIGKTVRTGVAAALFLAGSTIGAPGDVSGGGSSSSSTGTDLVRIRGAVVCTECALREIGELSPSESPCYQLSHTGGRPVLRVNWASNTARWHRMVWPPQLWVRSEEQL